MERGKTKFVFVSGGVVSSLGKGLAAASLGALLEATGMLEQERVVSALKRPVSPRFFDLDLAALARGRKEFRERAAGFLAAV